jgi:sigma-B regulation protein RsbU (phosphoserine phosphatase)
VLVSGPAGARAVEELGTPGPMIGMVAQAPFESGRKVIPEGARMYVFSDGVYEVGPADGALVDYDTFLKELTAESPEGALDHMVSFAKRWRGADSLDDDFSMVELQF